MTYVRRQPHMGAGRRLTSFALLLTPFVIIAGGQLVYSSGAPRRVVPHQGAVKPTPPRFLPTSCAPQLAVTPVASDTPTAHSHQAKK